MDAMDGDHGTSLRSNAEAVSMPLLSKAAALAPAGASERTPPREATFSGPVPDARELILQDDGTLALTGGPAVRDLVPDANVGMGALELILEDERARAQAAVEGARPPRDLVLDAHGGMSIRGGEAPQIPPPLKPKFPWEPDGGSRTRQKLYRWGQRVVSGKAPAPWTHRDGATLCWLPPTLSLPFGRLLLIGGWDTDYPFPGKPLGCGSIPAA